MTDPLRKRLSTRTKVTLAQVSGHTAKLTEAQKITPSERKSKSLRKKLARGVKVEEKINYDCYDCQKKPCGKTLAECGELAITMRCVKCGTKARVRREPGDMVDEYRCPVCLVRK